MGFVGSPYIVPWLRALRAPLIVHTFATPLAFHNGLGLAKRGLGSSC
jgi:hypothetical protein